MDKGMKYSPVFGRYAFLVPPNSSTTYDEPPERVAGRRKISVGDKVFVSKRNESRTVVGKTRSLFLSFSLSLSLSLLKHAKSIDNGNAEWPGLTSQS